MIVIKPKMIFIVFKKKEDLELNLYKMMILITNIIKKYKIMMNCIF